MKTAAQMIKDIRNRLLVSSFTPHPIMFHDLHDGIWYETGVHAIDGALWFENYRTVPGLNDVISHVTSTTFAIYPNSDFHKDNLARVYIVYIKKNNVDLDSIVLVEDEYNQFLEWLRTDETIQVQAIA